MKKSKNKTLSEQDVAKLMMMIGALHDLAEITFDSKMLLLKTISGQLKIINEKIEKIICAEEN